MTAQVHTSGVMRWDKPDFEIIEMNAEIGGYQSDLDPLEPLKETQQGAVERSAELDLRIYGQMLALIAACSDSE